MLFRWFEQRFDPYPAAMPAPPPRGLLAFVWAATAGCRTLIVLMLLLTAAIGVFEAMLFVWLGRLVDLLGHAADGGFWAGHSRQLLLLAGLLLLSPLLVWLQTLIKHQGLAGSLPMRLRWNFHRRLLGQSMAFFHDEFAGRVAAKVMQTAQAVRDTVFILTDIMVFIVIYFVSMAAILGHFSLQLLGPFAVWLLLYLASMRYFVPRQGRAARGQADARSLMTGRITDAYTNIASVKLFADGAAEADFARGAMREFMLAVQRQMRLVSLFELVNNSLSIVLLAATAGMALWLWSLGQIGIGAVAATTALALRLNAISHWVMWEMSNLFEQIGTVQDGINTLARPVGVVDRPAAPALQVTAGAIRFEQVGFAYGAGQRVIDRLDLDIRPGEKVGLVGRSGAGKSTLVNLLLRFYDLDAGRILIDGSDIATVSQHSLRRQIGMVTQDTSLLHRSIRANLCYGRPDASEAEMIAAARLAEAHDFIVGLRDDAGRSAYDTLVGERGVKLSGGQRQRIALARVMLKNAPILLLDEATSALDSEVEAAIQHSLDRLMQGKTVIAIAHRLSTIAAMDRLIVLDQGRIVEAGTHQALLAAGGHYARLWARQSGGFLGEEEEGGAGRQA